MKTTTKIKVDRVYEIKKEMEALDAEKKELLADLEPELEKTHTLYGDLGWVERVQVKKMIIDPKDFQKLVSMKSFLECVTVAIAKAKKVAPITELEKICDWKDSFRINVGEVELTTE